MPSGKAHVIAGTVCGAVGSVAIQGWVHKNKELDLSQMLISTGTGAALSRLPDILEPATDPNHRAFFHSFAFGGLLGFGGVKAWNKIKAKRAERQALRIEEISLEELLLGLVIIAIAAFLLHLLMDAFTKKGLPLI
jgi:membrane-bound metal-dependent hydrolase YbcI (DUF457 family)